MIKDNSYYKLKYLKYKSKYINYKILIGGDPPNKPLPLTPPLQQKKVEEIFDKMYPNINYDQNMLKKIELPLLQQDSQYNEKVIKFFIFLNMDFLLLVLLNDFEKKIILDHVKNNTLFQQKKVMVPGVVVPEVMVPGVVVPEVMVPEVVVPEVMVPEVVVLEVMVPEVVDMLDLKFREEYIPKLVIDILDNNGNLYFGFYQDILKKICNALLKLQFDSTFKCDFMNVWIHENYIKNNNALIRKLVDTITDDENYEIGTKILRSFIDKIRSDRSISTESKHEIMDKIDTLLVKLHNEYIETTKCNPQLRKLYSSKYPQKCYKLRNAHKLFEEVRKYLYRYKKELDELEEKKRLSDEKYKKLQEDTLLEITKLNELMQKINELMQKINTKLEDVKELKTKCLDKIDNGETISQLNAFKKKFDDSKNPDVLGNYYGVFKGIDANTIENECRNISPNIQFLSQALRILETNVNELKRKYIIDDIPIPIIQETVVS
jgi:uncharacterized protein YoxC